jgi:hypothetical protein
MRHCVKRTLSSGFVLTVCPRLDLDRDFIQARTESRDRDSLGWTDREFSCLSRYWTISGRGIKVSPALGVTSTYDRQGQRPNRDESGLRHAESDHDFSTAARSSRKRVSPLCRVGTAQPSRSPVALFRTSQRSLSSAKPCSLCICPHCTQQIESAGRTVPQAWQRAGSGLSFDWLINLSSSYLGFVVGDDADSAVQINSHRFAVWTCRECTHDEIMTPLQPQNCAPNFASNQLTTLSTFVSGPRSHNIPPFIAYAR